MSLLIVDMVFIDWTGIVKAVALLMYTNENLVVNAISDLSSNLEFFAVSIRCLNHKLCLGIFYRPPSSPSPIFDIFSQSLETLDISQFSNFVCVGDFNIDFNNSSHHLYPKLHSVSQLIGLSQVVTGYTHVSPSGHTSLIDLVLVSSPHHVCGCFVIPHWQILTTLDFILRWTSNQQPSQRAPAHVPGPSAWHYFHADFPLARQWVGDTNWNELFTDDIDSSWLNWQSKFMEIMEECIPS